MYPLVLDRYIYIGDPLEGLWFRIDRFMRFPKGIIIWHYTVFEYVRSTGRSTGTADYVHGIGTMHDAVVNWTVRICSPAPHRGPSSSRVESTLGRVKCYELDPLKVVSGIGCNLLELP